MESNSDNKKVKRLDPPNDDRREYLKTVGALVGGLAIGGAAAWLAKPTERIEVPGATVTRTETKTVTGSITPTRAVPLKYAHMHWGATLEPNTQMVETFSVAHPNIAVAVTQETWADAYRDITASIQAGTPFDVWHTGSTWHVEWMGMGGIEPLNDYIDRDVPEVKGDIYESFWDWITVDGKIAGFPFKGGTWGITYRPDLFEEAGLDPQKPPETWDDFIDYAKALTKPPDQWGVGTYASGLLLASNWLQIMYSAGCDILVKDNDKWESQLNTPEGISGMNAWADMIRTDKVMPEEVLGMDYTAALEAFKAGKFAMYIGGYFIVMDLINTLPGRFMTSKNPKIARFATRTSNHAYSMSSASKYKEEAWEFLKWAANKEYSLLSAKGDQIPTAYRSVNETDPFYQEDYFRAQLDSMPVAQPDPLCPAWGELSSIAYMPRVHSVMLGEMSVEEAVRLMDEDANATLEKRGFR